MAKNRKAKKAAKKFQEKNVPEKTAIAEAMEAASKASESSISVKKKPEVKKEKPKQVKKKPEVKKEKPKQVILPKTIIGFGSKGNSKTVHAIAALDRSALCDIRIKNIDSNDSFTANDVTCSSCKKYSTFKQMLVTTSHKPAEKAVKETHEKIDKKTEVKEPSKKEKETDEDYVTVQQITSMLNTRVRNMEKRLTIHFEEIIDSLLKARPDFFIIKSGIDQYSIVHNNSRLVICNGLTLLQAEKLLPLYLDIEFKWDGESKMPQEWMSSVKEVFQTLKKEVKKKKERQIKRRSKKKEKPIRELKRRKTEDKPRRIKRRSRN